MNQNAIPFARPLDLLIILFILGFSAFSFFKATRMSSPSAVMVLVDGKIVRSFSIRDIGDKFTVQGVLGESHFAIDRLGVKMLASPCSTKQCIHQGRVIFPGQAVICLPNRVALVLVGGVKRRASGINGVDGITQ